MENELSSYEIFEDLVDRLGKAVENGDSKATLAILKEVNVDDTARLIDRLDYEDRKILFELLTPKQAADVLEHVYYFQGADIIEELAPESAAKIIAALDSDDRADLMNELDEDDSSAILAELDEEVAEETRRFMSFPEGTAGAIMYNEFLSFPRDMTVAEILKDIQAKRGEYAEYGIQYAYVLDEEEKLRGVLPVRNLLFANHENTAAQVMIPEPITVHVETTVDELESLFERYHFLGLPVVDDDDCLIGVVDRESAIEARQEEATEDILKLQGLMGKEELRSMPLVLRSKRRLSWLSINIVLNVISASVIALHQDTLEAVIALAVFLPIISDMSGCSGTQAVAVSMRELSLQLVSPREFMRVFYKESSVGLINGACLGVLLGSLAWIWKGNPFLGFVVGIALALNTTIAVCVGGLVPLLLKGVGQDPALASGPILTTITDLCGFLLILSLASQMLPLLT